MGEKDTRLTAAFCLDGSAILGARILAGTSLARRKKRKEEFSPALRWLEGKKEKEKRRILAGTSLARRKKREKKGVRRRFVGSNRTEGEEKVLYSVDNFRCICNAYTAILEKK